jgi:hypothetical protein
MEDLTIYLGVYSAFANYTQGSLSFTMKIQFRKPPRSLCSATTARQDVAAISLRLIIMFANLLFPFFRLENVF